MNETMVELMHGVGWVVHVFGLDVLFSSVSDNASVICLILLTLWIIFVPVRNVSFWDLDEGGEKPLSIIEDEAIKKAPAQKSEDAQISLDKLLAPMGVNAPKVELLGIAVDSRKVEPGSLFVAIKGHQVDGREFINDALTRGAVAVVYESDSKFTPPVTDIPCIGIANLPRYLSALAGRFYNNPAKHMEVIGVTGTNGKSSVTMLVANWAALLGKKSAVMGTLGNGIIGELAPSANTTGNALEVQQNLDKFRQEGVELVAMEVSSHGLVEHRVNGIIFSKAAFTNLSRDHLDFHGTMEAYADAKALIFRRARGEGSLIINADDPQGEIWLSQRQQAVGYTMNKLNNSSMYRHPGPYVALDSLEYLERGFRAQVTTKDYGSGELHVNLMGPFNVSNTLAALALLLSLGYKLEDLLAVAPQLRPVTGRMECFGGGEQPLVVVDYAHTPDGLEKALEALKVHVKEGRIWCIFGCGGDRDKGKRPMMAEIAERFADKIILTNDNPRSEDPQAIINDILAGCRRREIVLVEPDRTKAIEKALVKARRGDVILVAGKGHENYQIVGTEVLSYSDRTTAVELLGRLAAGKTEVKAAESKPEPYQLPPETPMVQELGTVSADEPR